MKTKFLVCIGVLSVIILLLIFYLIPTPAKNCSGFRGSKMCRWQEYRTHCKTPTGKGCSAQYRECQEFYSSGTKISTGQQCGDWQNRL